MELLPVKFTPTPVQITEAQQKGKAWQEFGQAMALNNMELSFKAQQLKPPLPTKEEDIANADIVLAALKKSAKELQDQRKVSTSKLDNVTSVMMTHEKAVEAYIKTYEAALLPLKQKKRDEDNKSALRTQELQRFRETMQIQYNEFVANADRTIQRIKTEKYEFALKNIVLVDNYIIQIKNEVTEKTFLYNRVVVEDVEKQKIIDDIFSDFVPSVFVAKFAAEVDLLFSDFAVAKANATEAILTQQVKVQAANKDIQQSTEMKNVSASLDSAVSTTNTVTQYTKPLKDFYVVEMPHTETSVIRIMAAFGTNMILAIPEMRVTDLFNIDINKMAAALAAIKNKDKNFAPKDIIFVQKDKI